MSSLHNAPYTLRTPLSHTSNNFQQNEHLSYNHNPHHITSHYYNDGSYNSVGPQPDFYNQRSHNYSPFESQRSIPYSPIQYSYTTGTRDITSPYQVGPTSSLKTCLSASNPYASQISYEQINRDKSLTRSEGSSLYSTPLTQSRNIGTSSLFAPTLINKPVRTNSSGYTYTQVQPTPQLNYSYNNTLHTDSIPPQRFQSISSFASEREPQRTHSHSSFFVQNTDSVISMDPHFTSNHQKIKLPSISDIKVFNFKPINGKKQRYPISFNDSVEINVRPNIWPLKSKSYSGVDSSKEDISNIEAPPVPKQTEEVKSPKPEKIKYLSTFEENSKLKLNHKVTKVSKRHDYSTKSNQSLPKFFSHYTVDEDFLLTNILREDKNLSKILQGASLSSTSTIKEAKNSDKDDVSTKWSSQYVPSSKVQSFDVDDDDILRWYIMEFFFGYLNLNDVRDDLNNFKYDKSDEFQVKLDFEICESDESVILDHQKIRKKITVKIIAAKAESSKVTKTEILQVLDLNFTEFFCNVTKYKDFNKKKPLISLRHMRPSWSIGSKDELTVLKLNVDIKRL